MGVSGMRNAAWALFFCSIQSETLALSSGVEGEEEARLEGGEKIDGESSLFSVIDSAGELAVPDGESKFSSVNSGLESKELHEGRLPVNSSVSSTIFDFAGVRGWY